jgi:acyl dehydratase
MGMTLAEWNKAVDEWVAFQNQKMGKVFKPGIGMYPPKGEGLIVQEVGVNNKLCTKDLIRHYCDAIGDTNPLWREDDYAKTSRYGGVIAPPRWLDCVAPPYGMGMGFPNFGVPGMNPLNRGSKITWYKVVRPGDEFHVHDRYLETVEVTKKERPMPRLFLFDGERKYINQRDEVVAVATGGAIVVGSGPELKGTDPTFDKIKRHKYTQQEIDEIAAAYEAEKRQGIHPLYWEDVVEGSEMPKLVKGPLTYMDSVAFFTAIGYTSGFKVTYELMKECPGWGVPDPELGIKIPAAGIHVSDTNARMQGVPFAGGFSAQLEGNMVHAICNWMGDDGFLKHIDCQARRLYTLGDMVWIKGKVVRKFVENGEHLVELSLTATNQDNDLIMPVKAIVSLLSKAKDW